MSTFHLYKSLFYVTILTKSQMVVLDLNRMKLVSLRNLPSTVIFDAVQLNPDLNS